jgi:hypothetical protein
VRGAERGFLFVSEALLGTIRDLHPQAVVARPLARHDRGTLKDTDRSWM